MTTTAERIRLISEACQHPVATQHLGPITTDDLSHWVATELAHADALDSFRPHGPLLTKAQTPKTILHIVSGNTPHAALQSLLRGLLLGSHNTIKTPSSGIPELTEWIASLPPPLTNLVKTTSNPTDINWESADAVIAIGSDTTIASIQSRIQPHQTFIPHGHKISIGIVYNDHKNAAALAARDASLFNQRGCLSPHAIYVRETPDSSAKQFASQLAEEMEQFSLTHPPEPINISEAGAIRNLREITRFTSANDPSTSLWESHNNLSWTVIKENSSTLHLSCLNRCVYVKPLPEPPSLETLGDQARHLSTIAIHPFSVDQAEKLTSLSAHRICPLGRSQQPGLFWHHDGFAPLASLVKWKDLG